MMTLAEHLEQYAKSDAYPFHMPGHKRQIRMKEDVYQYDITEILSFDNLYEADGILHQLRELAKETYHSKESYLLVNGSTVGNFVSIFAATKRGDAIIIGRNAHKSVYHAAMLRELVVTYTQPEVSEIGMVLRTPISEFEHAIKESPEAKAIVVTSPTYEGMIEDIPAIADLAHAHGMILIVDAAHGAHLGVCEELGTNPVEQGADLVVMSLHKTMPALTQTGLLHVGTDSEISPELVARYLEMFQTSSPSYALMTSMEQALLYRRDHVQDFSDYAMRMEDFFSKCKNLHYLKAQHLSNQDITKVVIDTSYTKWTGYEVMSMLRDEFSLELEMASFAYCLAMTSVVDTAQGLERLFAALWVLDDRAEPVFREDTEFYVYNNQIEPLPENAFALQEVNALGGKIASPEGWRFQKDMLQELYAPGEKVMEMHEAFNAETKCVALDVVVGGIAARNVLLYPPGVPVFVAGERITARKAELLLQARGCGLTITGLEDGCVNIVK